MGKRKRRTPKQRKRTTRPSPKAFLRAPLPRDAFNDNEVSTTALNVLAEYFPNHLGDELPALTRKLLDGAARHATRKRRGGVQPGAAYHQCRKAVADLHAKDPRLDFLPATHQVAGSLALTDRYVRTSCRKNPSLEW